MAIVIFAWIAITTLIVFTFGDVKRITIVDKESNMVLFTQYPYTGFFVIGAAIGVSILTFYILGKPASATTQA